jgi:hypothetical protein
MRSIFLLGLLNILSSIFAHGQQKEIDVALKNGKTKLGYYVAYPKKLTTEKFEAWKAKNTSYYFYDVKTKDISEFGTTKEYVTEIYFVENMEEYRRLKERKLIALLESGNFTSSNMRQVTAIIKNHPDYEISSSFESHIVKNYEKISTLKYNSRLAFAKPLTDDEKNLASDLKELLMACTQCHSNANIKEAVLKYTAKELGNDLVYYFDIFHDYGNMTPQEINDFDDRTYQAIITKQDCGYYLHLFPDRKYVAHVKALLAGGLYEYQIKAMETAKTELLKVIKTRKGIGLLDGVGLSNEIIIYDLFNRYVDNRYAADKKFNDMLRLIQDFKQNFTNNDPKGKVSLADFIAALLNITDGLWGSMLDNSGTYWEVHGCSWTKKSYKKAELMGNAIGILENLIKSGTEPVDVFKDAFEYLSTQSRNFGAHMAINIQRCKAEVQARESATKVRLCDGCAVNWDKTGNGKLTMKNGSTYDYSYYNGSWRIEHLFWFDDTFDTYEELVTHFLQQCEKQYCQ